MWTYSISFISVSVVLLTIGCSSTYDGKSNTVTVSGPFDEVANRLTSDASKNITNIHLVGSRLGGGRKQKNADAANACRLAPVHQDGRARLMF